MVLQSIIFSRNIWTEDSARRWLFSHNHTWDSKVDYTLHFMRFRQEKPKSGAYYYTIKLKMGVELIYMS